MDVARLSQQLGIPRTRLVRLIGELVEQRMLYDVNLESGQLHLGEGFAQDPYNKIAWPDEVYPVTDRPNGRFEA